MFIRLVGILSAMGALLACEPDDPKAMADAKAACLSRAKGHLKTLYGGQNVEFENVGNVHSDPTPHAFEYHWPRRKMNGYEHRREFEQYPRPTSYDVKCRGYAGQRVITLLIVEGAILAGSYEGSLDPSSPAAVHY